VRAELCAAMVRLLRTNGVVSLSGAGVHRRALAFSGESNRYALIQQFSKNNISLIIESIAK